MATEVWDSEAGDRMDRLVAVVRDAGIEQQPQTAMFSVPQMYAVAYRRAAPTPVIPRQPGPPAVEQEPATTTSAASTTG
jgi:hypothetical protein